MGLEIALHLPVGEKEIYYKKTITIGYKNNIKCKKLV